MDLNDRSTWRYLTPRRLRHSTRLHQISWPSVYLIILLFVSVRNVLLLLWQWHLHFWQWYYLNTTVLLIWNSSRIDIGSELVSEIAILVEQVEQWSFTWLSSNESRSCLCGQCTQSRHSLKICTACETSSGEIRYIYNERCWYAWSMDRAVAWVPIALYRNMDWDCRGAIQVS